MQYCKPKDNTMKIIYRKSLLSICGIGLLLVIVLYTLIGYGYLTTNGGWGLLANIAMATYCAIAIVVDFILQQIFRERKTLLIAECIFIVIAIAWFCIS
jgi:hypothetical protein